VNRDRKKHRESLRRLIKRWLMCANRRISATQFTYDLENELKKFDKEEAVSNDKK